MGVHIIDVRIIDFLLYLFILCVCVVALFRRGTACAKTCEWEEAISSLERLLGLEPSNKKARDLLSQARKSLSNSNEVTKNKKGKGGHHIKIEEEKEEEEKEEEEKGGEKELSPRVPVIDSLASSAETLAETLAQPAVEQTAPTPPVRHVSKATPMPTKVLELKEKGNDLFRRGQYGDAVLQYTSAMEELATGKLHSMGGAWQVIAR